MAAPLNFRALLPPTVACAETGEVSDTSGLLGLERDYAERMVAGRRGEFAAGRRSARVALASLGIAPMPILRSPRRAPVWPAGIVGSITHGTGMAAAAVARESDILGLGIDMEMVARFSDAIATRICTDDEFDRLPAMQSADRLVRIALTFSAKECVHKLWAPRMGGTLPFTAVEVMAAEAPAFTIRVVPGGPASPACDWQLQGLWSIESGRIRTALILTA